nr:hypothetical protein [Tanacetum cinerariifolium]
PGATSHCQLAAPDGDGAGAAGGRRGGRGRTAGVPRGPRCGPAGEHGPAGAGWQPPRQQPARGALPRGAGAGLGGLGGAGLCAI